MRLVFILFIVVIIAGAGFIYTRKSVAEAPTGAQWFNVFGEGNRVLAAVNLSEKNSVKYFDDPKAAFDALFIGHMTYRQSCEKALAEKEKAKK